MIGPGPDEVQLRTMIAVAARTPDHGKLAPWRFVIIAPDARDRLAEMLRGAYLSDKPDAGHLELEAMDNFAQQAPALVVVLSTPRTDSHIPLWEQQLSAGAATMNLLHAAHAAGFVASWITGWPAYSEIVRDQFGGADDRIAGFVFIGTAGQPLEERPRPDHADIASIWQF